MDLAATNVLLSMPKNRACQQNRSNVTVDNPSAYWKLNIYLPFIDHLLAELLTSEQRYKAQYLLPKKVADLTHDLVNEVYDSYEGDYNKR